MNIKKVLYMITGIICLGLGTIGTVLPVLPTVPFFLGAAYCFARSSRKLHNWFIGTKMYKNNLESYVAGHGMTKETKMKIMGSVTAVMAVGFVIMFTKGIYIPCAIMAVVWLCHILFFVFKVKTIKAGL